MINDGLIGGDHGNLTITAEMVNHGVLRLRSGATLQAEAMFINQGLLDLLSAGSGLPSEFQNEGQVLTAGDLALSGHGWEGAGFTLVMPTYEGHLYQLQASPDMSPGSWGPVGPPQAGDGSSKSFTDPAPAGPRRFLRVAVDP